MISVNEAIERIRHNTNTLPPVTAELRHAGGLVLAEDVFAGINIPGFHQSAVDGYAFRFVDFLKTKEFEICGEVAAGDNQQRSFQPQQAVRIFTGAAVPPGFDTVVMQEKTEKNNHRVVIKDEMLVQGGNVRPEGSEIKKGALALAKGTVLTPAATGFLAGLGVTHVAVYPKPVVHIIVTGKELQKPGNPLEHGQIYESNGLMLQAALEQFHIRNAKVDVAGDDLREITQAIELALENADLVILTGGVSVGSYDFVVQAAEACDVDQLFHKVAQRPGKPLYAGIRNEKLVFGLPGNPASVLSCFYNYVVVAIEEFTGRKSLLQRKQFPLAAGFNKKIQLCQFLKGACLADGVMPLQAQESFRLSSFSVADCLIVLPEEAREYKAGDTVEVILLPYL